MRYDSVLILDLDHEEMYRLDHEGITTGYQSILFVAQGVECKMSEAIKGQPVVQKEKRRKSTSFITDPTKRRRFDQRQVKQMKKKV
eukprot:gene5115-5762_t